ncbi:MAG: hydroxymethylbilane synthase [Methanomicrobiales archaeon]|nr:hydroxymethylbilane synthase [Methanomicrobiales archaeon]MDI6876422.1 hydroxymethylbilane synthase [Methanomicrobiales archaeon]
MSLRLGTRGSRLALVQTEKVARALADRGIEVETVIVRTQGDVAAGVPLHEIGGQGVFVRALDEAILDGEIDAAVHSMKDIPARRPEGVVTAAILARDSPADYLIFEGDLDDVQVVGTSSTRRRAQLLRHDPSLTIRPLRGNVDTRLRRLALGDFDAIVLAEAGLERMEIEANGMRLPVTQFVPSANQGTIGVVARDDPALISQLRPLDDTATRVEIGVERAVMEELGGGCFTPNGIFCSNGRLIAEVLSLDGERTERIDQRISTLKEARECGRMLREKASDLIADAARQLRLTE